MQVHATPLAVQQRSIAEEVSTAYAAFKAAGGLSKRDVVSPPILKPDASSVWPIGTSQEVVWDITGLPASDEQITNRFGRIILGRDTGDSLNLDIENPLASGFSIRLGRINVTVPNVPPRNDYLIVLMGNSGNTSPSFAITQISGNNSGAAPTTASTVVTTSTEAEQTPSLPGIAPTRSSEPPVIPTSTTVTDPIPISGTTITGGETSLPEQSEVASTPSSRPVTTLGADETGPADSTGEGSDNSEDAADDTGAAAGTKAHLGALLGCVLGGAFVLGF